MERGDDEFIRTYAPVLFRAADKFFKFVSWAIVIALLKFAEQRTESTALYCLLVIAYCVFGITLLSQLLLIIVRSPDDLKIPARFHWISRVLQVVVGLTLVIILTAPLVSPLDGMIDALMNARTK